MKKQTPIPFDDYFQYNCNNTRSHSRTLAALTQEHLFPLFCYKRLSLFIFCKHDFPME